MKSDDWFETNKAPHLKKNKVKVIDDFRSCCANSDQLLTFKFQNGYYKCPICLNE